MSMTKHQRRIYKEHLAGVNHRLGERKTTKGARRIPLWKWLRAAVVGRKEKP